MRISITARTANGGVEHEESEELADEADIAEAGPGRQPARLRGSAAKAGRPRAPTAAGTSRPATRSLPSPADCGSAGPTACSRRRRRRRCRAGTDRRARPPRASLWRSTNTTTMAAPARLASQNPRLGRSCATSAAAAAVASGMMPSTTPPCAAGTLTMASAISTGKPMMVQSPASANSAQSSRGGSGLRSDQRATRGRRSPAMVARAADQEQRIEDGDREPGRRQRAAEQSDAGKAECEPSFSRETCRRHAASAPAKPSASKAARQNWRGPGGFSAEPPYNVSAGL